jgi:type VI secretion system protein ImpC
MRLDDLFEQSIQETESRSGGPSPGRALDDFSALLRDIVSPHVVPRDDPRQPELIAQVDAAIASRMRACLHHPAFQELEAAWRALFLLVRRLETGGELKLYIIDISKAELDAELKRAGDVRTANTCRLLVEQTVGTPGAEPWSVIAGNYTFEDTSEDVQLLLILANIAWAARAPFLAAASPHIVGCESFGAAPHPDQWQRRDNELWKALRSVPEARWIGLALPRFLLRMPYGKETDPIEYFEFEELENGAAHEDYLWSNPAFACVCLLGQAFGEAGWQMRPGMVRDLDGLPAHVRYQDGEACLKPCAEALMTENAAEILMDTGLMPLLSIKGRDIVRLARFQSIASPPSPLGGRWA